MISYNERHVFPTMVVSSNLVLSPATPGWCWCYYPLLTECYIWLTTCYQCLISLETHKCCNLFILKTRVKINLFRLMRYSKCWCESKHNDGNTVESLIILIKTCQYLVHTPSQWLRSMSCISRHKYMMKSFLIKTP